MRALLILACSATKLRNGGLTPAIDRYDGPAYRVLRKALRERPGLGERLTIAILSAEFGLIPADQPIPYYDRRMTSARAAELLPGVSLAVNAYVCPPIGPVFINVGADYHRALPDSLPWPATWARGGIGERLGQLKEWLWAQ